MHTTKLVLIRHGESQWNKENRFTGWVDIDLSNKGHTEAQYAGQLLKNNGFIFDIGYTSMLTRAIRTLWIILNQLNQVWLPIEKSWHLNERHYGALQGLNKDEAIKQYGNEVVQKWRRGFDVIPPRTDENYEFCGTNDIRYRNVNIDLLPNGESLLLTLKRVIYYWNNDIIPHLKNQKRIIIVAHGNSIRAIIKFLNNLSASEIFQINVPTGMPLIYEFDANIRPIRHYYLHDNI